MSSWIQRLAGRFLVFDGPDGSGKSTQLDRLAALARQAGVPVCEARDPGGTSIGEAIRSVLLDPANAEMSVRCELMLYMASRAQLVEERIRPALQRGEIVLGDRFVSSTLAYQGIAGGVSREDVLSAARLAIGDVWPDLTVIFDVDEHVAAHRLNPLLDRMERKGADFHRRVRRGFLAQAEASPADHLVIDAAPEPAIVFERLAAALEDWVHASGEA
jgi:dTMP kinase